MKSGGKSYRRRNLLSYPRAQLKIIAIFAFLALAFATVNCYVSRSALQRLAEGVLSGDPRLPVSRSDIRITFQREDQTLGLQLVSLTFLSFAVMMMGSVYLSHKIAGPIYRLNKYLTDMAGDKVKPQRITFRKYDFFKDLAANFNEFQKSQGILHAEKPPEPPETAGR